MCGYLKLAPFLPCSSLGLDRYGSKQGRVVGTRGSSWWSHVMLKSGIQVKVEIQRVHYSKLRKPNTSNESKAGLDLSNHT
ncbi:hypothetical protein CDL15_Pgr005234 [Punica granatum]|uniref:Uncharacterized protein n=1 Tax=Punica granatum TaxID=22663 RepID=A0A218WP96_PUNGR|nr:hypothetical protein CDL15_Pgr005234 [Punica granatum]